MTNISISPDTNFYKATLEEANLSGLDLRDISFKEAILDKANLQGSDLNGTDLRNASLNRAKLKSANLKDSRLQGAALTEAEGMSMSDNLESAQWGNTKCPDGTNSDDSPYNTCENNTI